MKAEEYKRKMKKYYIELYSLETDKKIILARMSAISKSIKALNQYLVRGDDEE
jgi:hypothetical protein